MYGKSEINKLVFKSEIIANAANVIPIAKDPVLPTKILPRKLKKTSMSHTINGTYRSIARAPDTNMSPIRIIAGHIVSKPFNPPS
jgi:hypothetical protein